MDNLTEQELKAVHDKNLPWLRQMEGYTGSYLGVDSKGNKTLVVQFGQVTPAIQAAVTERFQGYPTEIRSFPMARAR